jgi:hypothetical protein
MAYASYRLHRIGWVAWRWVADYRGERSCRGMALTERSARSAARSWLQAQADADESPASKRPTPGAPGRHAQGSDPAVRPGFGRRAVSPVRRAGVAA